MRAIEIFKTVGRNLGNDVEIVSGVSLSDRIVDSPQETLASGDKARIGILPAEARRPAHRSKGRVRRWRSACRLAR
jgi:hypothetical protein